MFDWLFNFPRNDFEAGTLTFASGYPHWLLMVLLVAGAAALAVSLWIRRKHLSAARLWTLWILQFAVISVLLAMIWQPALEVKTLVPGENSVAVLLDNSASMRYQHNDSSRLQSARAALGDDVGPALSGNFDLTYGSFAADLSWQDNLEQLPPAGKRSNIAEALLQVLEQARAEPLAAVVLASDGSDNSRTLNNSDTNRQLWDKLAAFDVPVHTIGVGRESMPEDVEIVGIDLPPTTLPGSVERATVTMRHGTASSARIKVYAGDDIIAIKEHPLPGQAGETNVNIELDASDPGLQELRFEIEPDASDTIVQNNSRRKLLQVEEQQRRILYFEGEPRWEYKFIRRAVANSKSLSLVTILRTTPNKFYRQGIERPDQHADGFPSSKKELYAYDAVIIGNVESISLNAAQHQLIHDYVSERGGTLMMLAGSSALGDGGWQNSPVAKTLPVTMPDTGAITYARQRVKASLTASGARSPITRLDNDPQENLQRWEELPELADFQQTGAAKPGADVLLNGTTQTDSYPLLSTQRYGNGNTWLLASSGTWRWQMQLPSEDLRHETFWQQLLQAVASTAVSRLRVTTNEQVYLDNTQVEITTKVLNEEFEPASDAAITASLISPDGTRSEITLQASADTAGEYNTTIEAASAGSWQLDINATAGEQEIGRKTRWVYREDGTAEAYGLPQNSAFLKRLSSSTGGQYWTTDNASGIAAAIRAARSGIVRQQTLPLWNAPFFFLLLLGIKLFEWLLRLLWGRL